jgi:hypothetical protein
MSRYYAVSLEDLSRARVAYERDEPRDLFYRVAGALIADAEAGVGRFSTVEGLAILLQSWNLGWYRRQRHAFDQAHYTAIGDLLDTNKARLARLRERPVETMTADDRPTVEQTFDHFAGVLGPVGSAKTLHLLAPRWFPIFDNYILGAFHIWGRDGRAYWQFMTAIQAQVHMVGGETTAGPMVVKALDELSFCRFTLRLAEFKPPHWIELQGARDQRKLETHLPSAARDQASGTKSSAMRLLFEQGQSVADAARAVGVPYQFAYGVHRRWEAKREGS